jgi:hypothetical protein
MPVRGSQRPLCNCCHRSGAQGQAGLGRIYDLLRELLTAGLIVLLVEQDVSQALWGVSRAQDLGMATLEGSPEGLTAEQKDCTENPHQGAAPTTRR